MPTHGPAAVGTALQYNSGHTYTPTVPEQVNTNSIALGTAGQGLANVGSAVPAVNPLSSYINGGLQIAGGAITIFAAVATDVGTAGALTPVDVVAATGGLASIVQGLQTITGATNQQVNKLPTSPGGLTTGQAAQLADIHTQAGSNSSIMQAVWHTFDPFLGADEVDLPRTWGGEILETDAALDLLATGLGNANTNLSTLLSEFRRTLVDGWSHVGPLGMFGIHMHGSVTATVIEPVVNVNDVRDTDTVGSWLGRNNPGLTVSAGGYGPGYVFLSDVANSIDYWCGLSPAMFAWIQGTFFTPSSGPPIRALPVFLRALASIASVQYP